MNTQRRHLGALEYINDILLARARLAQAKSDLAVAGARAQAAKRGRARNSTAIRLARKQVRHADREFTRARAILAKIEKKYFAMVQHARKQAVGSKPLHAQAKRLASAVRIIKEKRPSIIFRGYPLASSASQAAQKKENQFNQHRQQ
jgi:hypothetical protein